MEIQSKNLLVAGYSRTGEDFLCLGFGIRKFPESLAQRRVKKKRTPRCAEKE
jgi:hypothetical protein